MKRLAALTALILLSTAAAAQNDIATQAILDMGGTVNRSEPDWLIVCIGGRRDELGNIPVQKHCRLEKRNFTAILRISQEGIRIPLRETISPCDFMEAQLAVDQRQIQKMSPKQKLTVLNKGNMVARSFQTAWPYCDPQIEATSLKGFASAYGKLKSAWQKFGGDN